MSSNQLPLFEGSSSSTSQAAKHSEKNARKLSIKADLNADELKQLMHQLQLHVRQYDPRAQVAEVTQTANTASSNCVDASQKQSWIELPFVCVDCETTGLDPRDSRVIEVAWVHMQQCNIVNTQNRLCNIPDPLPEFTVQMTGITDEMLQGQPAFRDHADELIRAIQNAHFVVAYNADFDKRFLESELQQIGKSLPQKPWVDPYVFIREIDRYKRGKKLVDAAARWGVTLQGAHRAEADAVATAQLLCKLAPRIPHTDLSALLAWQDNIKRQQEQSFRDYLARKQNNSPDK